MSDQEKPERLFIGVPITAGARAAIVRLLPKNIPGKPVPSDNWHFTLRFLGATRTETRDKLLSDLAAESLGPSFTIHFNELGAFPNPRRARVLWLGVDRGTERMQELAAIVETSARRAGFEAEARAFTPHLTLARIDPPTSVATLISSRPRVDVSMLVESLVLFRSRLGGGPARYEVVARFELAAGIA